MFDGKGKVSMQYKKYNYDLHNHYKYRKIYKKLN